jgi:hypothetical protein
MSSESTTQIVQQPLVGLAQMIIQPLQLPQGELSLMEKVLVTFHTSLNDLGFLHWTPKVMFIIMFSKRFQLWSILNQTFDWGQCTFYKHEKHF